MMRFLASWYGYQRLMVVNRPIPWITAVAVFQGRP